MTTPNEATVNGPLDAYLDARLTGGDAAAFEERVTRDPALRGEVALQRAIDASIARCLHPPAAENLRAVVDAARREAAVRVTPRMRGGSDAEPLRRWLAVAASVALCVAGGWLTWSALRPSGAPRVVYEPPPRRTMAEVYQHAVASGFEPPIVCRDAAEFEGWFVDRFGRGLLLLDALPAGVAVTGLGYVRAISEDTIYVLVEAGDRRIMVFVDSREAASGTAPGAVEDGLHLFRREVGGLVLFELSPLDEPVVIPHARAADDAARDEARDG